MRRASSLSPAASRNASIGALESGQDQSEWSGVQRVDLVESASDPDDLSASGFHDLDVLAFGVAEDQGGNAAGHQPTDDALGETGFPGARGAAMPSPKNCIIGISSRNDITPPAHMIDAMRGPMI